MSSAFFGKIRRDVDSSLGRLGLLGLALGAGVFVVTLVASSASVLLSAMRQNYEETNPASATLEFGKPVDASVLEAVKSMPGVLSARTAQNLRLRVEDSNGHWQPLLVFVSPDPGSLEIGNIFPQDSPWPPKAGEFALERTALSTFGLSRGQKLNVQTEDGRRFSAVLGSVVHDPSVAPAYQERTAYGYADSATVQGWGLLQIDQIKIRVDQKLDTAGIRGFCARLARDLSMRGIEVSEIQVPPAHMHPHQGILTALLVILGCFGVLTIILCSLLAANAASSYMAREKKSIGILKTIGAPDPAIQAMVLSSIALTGVIAVCWGVPAGLIVFPALTGAISQLLNFTVHSMTPAVWAWLIPLLLGLILPVVMTLPISLRSQRSSILSVLNDQGTDTVRFGERKKLSTFARRFPLLDMSFRNALRKKKRLILSLFLMGLGGGIFLTSFNLSQSWQNSLKDSYASRKYDYQLRLLKTPSSEDLSAIAQALPSLGALEVWPSLPATTFSPEGIAVDSVYPDEAHGSFRVFGTPSATKLVRYPALSGVWAHEPGEIVLNQAAKARFSDARVGDRIDLFVSGSRREYTLAGVVKELGQAAAYIDPAAFHAFPSDSEARSDVLLRLNGSVDAVDAQKKLTAWVERRSLPLELLVDSKEFEIAGAQHFTMLIVIIMLMGLVTGVVGWMGVSSMLSLAVIERRKEFGILRSIGATPNALVGSLLLESSVTLVLGFCAALLLSLPITSGLGTFLGNISLRTPLSLSVNFSMASLWLVASLAGGLCACIVPAVKAARQTVRETLTV